MCIADQLAEAPSVAAYSCRQHICLMQSLKDSATKAGTNISKIADNMSTWWANLDPVQKGSPSPEGHGSRPVATQVLPICITSQLFLSRGVREV